MFGCHHDQFLIVIFSFCIDLEVKVTAAFTLNTRMPREGSQEG